MMNDYYCLEIEFKDVDFSAYSIKGKTEVSKVHNAHLSTKDNEIELKILFDDQTYFGDKFMNWISQIQFKKFGSYLKVEVTKNYRNEHLQRVDLSGAKLIGCNISSNFYENGKKYIIIKIDSVKFYWDPNEEKVNTAEFYLDDKGFRVVEPFYGIFGSKTLFKNDGKFEINRMNDSTQFYKLEKSTFRPEFNIYSKDKKNDRTATIIKEPKIQFKYHKEISEDEAIFYGDVVLMMASFYHHIKIDFILRRIYLPESTISIKNIEQKNYFDTKGNLWGFGIYWNYNKFLQSSWQKETLKNFGLLSKAVKLFNQSLLVDDSSAFLIRYNIIEICGKKGAEDEFWNFKLKNDDLENFFNDIKVNISNLIDETEQEYFNNKWNSIQNIIKSKSLRKQLEDSLNKHDINVESLPIRTSKIVQLRNNITHGSLDKVNVEDLIKTNILLYRISGILILNLMGIKDWKLNTKIK
jgi:hypothetical protein